MKEIQRLLSFVRRAVDDYGMIAPGDKIAVGISGGKDSMALLTALAHLRRFYPIPFSLCGITVDMGFAGSDFSVARDYCASLDVEYRVVQTDIAKIVFDIRKESNPCSLCAKLRRGSLHTAAREMGVTRVALGHHFDDVVDTFMMNLFFEGRLGCFQPVTYLSNTGLYLIRPLLYAQEKDVRYCVRKAGIPVIESLCPENHATERENMKLLLAQLERENHGLRHRIFRAICKGGIDGYKLTNVPVVSKEEE